MREWNIETEILRALQVLPKNDRDVKTISTFLNPNFELFSEESEEGVLMPLIESMLNKLLDKKVVKKKSISIQHRKIELWNIRRNAELPTK